MCDKNIWINTAQKHNDLETLMHNNLISVRILLGCAFSIAQTTDLGKAHLGKPKYDKPGAFKHQSQGAFWM